MRKTYTMLYEYKCNLLCISLLQEFRERRPYAMHCIISVFSVDGSPVSKTAVREDINETFYR